MNDSTVKITQDLVPFQCDKHGCYITLVNGKERYKGPVWMRPVVLEVPGQLLLHETKIPYLVSLLTSFMSTSHKVTVHLKGGKLS